MREGIFEIIADTTQENQERDKDILQIHVIRHPNNHHRLSIYKGTAWKKSYIDQKDIEKGVWKLLL